MTMSTAAVAAACIAACWLSGYGSAGARVLRRNAAAQPQLTASQLAAELVAAASMTGVPANLDPSVATAANAYTSIVTNRCEVVWSTLVTARPCVYGDRRSLASVVLFGDSHASAWFPALRLVSEQERWRLLILTKVGCSPPEVTVLHPEPYTECTSWRHNTELQIAALHPALVIVSWARWIAGSSTVEPGVPTPYANPWLNGVKAIFDILRETAKHVIFISDVPLLNIDAPSCVSRNLSDVLPCNDNPLATSFYNPTLGAQEIKLARLEHINWIDPTPWFCSPASCPAVVGRFLLYRDNSHMTPPWSRYIAPVLRDAIESIIPGLRGSCPRRNHSVASSPPCSKSNPGA